MKVYRLFKVAKALNVGVSTLVEILGSCGHEIDNKPTAKITSEHLDLIAEKLAIELSADFKSKQCISNTSFLVSKQNLERYLEALNRTLLGTIENPQKVINDIWVDLCSGKVVSSEKSVGDQFTVNQNKEIIKKIFLFKIRALNKKVYSKIYLDLKLIYTSLVTHTIYYIFPDEDDHREFKSFKASLCT